MSGRRPRASQSAVGTMITALATATRVVDHAVREREESDRPATVCAETWQRVRLLGAFGELTAMPALQIGSDPQRCLLHADTGSAQHVAHACRDMAVLRRALGDGEHAARQIHTARSHQNPLPAPDRGSGSAGGADRDPAAEGS